MENLLIQNVEQVKIGNSRTNVIAYCLHEAVSSCVQNPKDPKVEDHH